MKKVGIIGGSGYTGGELIRLLLQHPALELEFVYSTTRPGKALTQAHPDLLGSTTLQFTDQVNLEIDVVYLCLGHGNSVTFLKEYTFSEQTLIVDLGNDFRLKQDANFDGRTFVYGLPELQREVIEKANTIANPGCFATALQLALLPLAKTESLKSDVHIHATTGSTGAGVGLSPTSHFSWRNNNFSWYKPFTHQHLGEIHQSLEQLHSTPKIHFLPHRGDFTRGIFATVYTEYNGSLAQAQSLYQNFYNTHPFTHVSDEEISLKSVINSNNCFLHLHKHENLLLITSILDNLIKGAAGQALQNTNLIMGWEENLGLQLKASTF
ncbi:N-acetyl-gamma-glutamyl-phosphate reductase [Flavobacteriaceae bacterium]|nr:N-acetyl-gamma-glutamyl-phosphate reductase [Flavobacteriaceae bacterium]MDC0872310.1 N-acetyl-gamma-glutamyl-phosphate reductase [Flavobacteriaceae bacterium]